MSLFEECEAFDAPSPHSEQIRATLIFKHSEKAGIIEGFVDIQKAGLNQDERCNHANEVGGCLPIRFVALFRFGSRPLIFVRSGDSKFCIEQCSCSRKYHGRQSGEMTRTVRYSSVILPSNFRYHSRDPSQPQLADHMVGRRDECRSDILLA
jgi:hypothetical protein